MIVTVYNNPDGTCYYERPDGGRVSLSHLTDDEVSDVLASFPITGWVQGEAEG